MLSCALVSRASKGVFVMIKPILTAAALSLAAATGAWALPVSQTPSLQPLNLSDLILVGKKGGGGKHHGGGGSKHHGGHGHGHGHGHGNSHGDGHSHGHEHGHGGRWWHGRWWGYGVGSCWRLTPAGYIWICGY